MFFVLALIIFFSFSLSYFPCTPEKMVMWTSLILFDFTMRFLAPTLGFKYNINNNCYRFGCLRNAIPEPFLSRVITAPSIYHWIYIICGP